MDRRATLAYDIKFGVGEFSLSIVNHPDFPRLLVNFIRDCEDLEDQATVEREERRERRDMTP